MIRKKTAVILSMTTALVFTLLSSCNFGPPENSRAAQAIKGKEHFEKYCVTCHGADGKGLDIEGLERKPADLTILIKGRSSGDFPIMNVARAIDGRNMPDYHKQSGMPIWGEVFATEENMDEKQLKGRFAELIAYLMSIQGT
jgi:mono/diheme cytochrome c family protein